MSLEVGLRGLHNPTTDAVLDARSKQVEAALGESANEQSPLVMSMLVGALMLARSIGNDQLSTRIMDVVRESLKARALAKGKAGQ